ncbi:MAG: hypothetical protein C5S49_06560 [Candidatus Methanogaster sp.]|nr:MAG: hypothetical protein C5S49_06560 [ANME-2 cluster archaeon]
MKTVWRSRYMERDFEMFKGDTLGISRVAMATNRKIIRNKRCFPR